MSVISFVIYLTFGIYISVPQTSGNGQYSTDVVENRFVEIETKFNIFLQDHIALKSEFSKLKNDHIELKNDNAALKHQVHHLREQNVKLERGFLDFKNYTMRRFRKIGRSHKDVKECHLSKQDIVSPAANNSNEENAGKQDIEEPKTNDRTGKRSYKKRLLAPSLTPTPFVPTRARVAFHAKMSQRLSNPGDNQHIEFDQVLTNDGGSYNGATGSFICPVSGTYVFSVTMLSLPDKWINTEIVKNGMSLALTYSFDTHRHNSGSTVVVVDLQENDTVWVRVHGNNHNTGDVAYENFSSFSGFILWSSE